MASLSRFESGSATHIVSLVACAAAIALAAWVARRWRGTGPGTVLRRVIGAGCLAVWLVNSAYWMAPARFHWEGSLPLHYCNMANLIGAAALLGSRRIWRALLYFWGLAFSPWAFLTPTLELGPPDPAFWIFWVYHLFIGLALAELLAGIGFRPNRLDLRLAIAVTFVFTVTLAVVDRAFGWNYGFVGPHDPKQPTPIDLLGDYPLRLVWLGMLAAGVFSLLAMPWRRDAGVGGREGMGRPPGA